MKREFEIISDLLPNDCRVLDVGCGDGTLMKFLSNEKSIDVRGLELNEKNVETCISKGLSVIEGDAEKALKHYDEALKGERVTAASRSRVEMKSADLGLGPRASVTGE